MRLSVRVSDDVAQQLSTISASRGIDLSSVVREAVASYLTTPQIDIRKPLSFGQRPPLRHTLDECVDTILCHWPQEIQERLTARWYGRVSHEEIFCSGSCMTGRHARGFGQRSEVVQSPIPSVITLRRSIHANSNR